jgi:hypothetical protein
VKTGNREDCLLHCYSIKAERIGDGKGEIESFPEIILSVLEILLEYFR